MSRLGVLALIFLCFFAVFAYAQENVAANTDEGKTKEGKAEEDSKGKSAARQGSGFNFAAIVGAANMSHTSGTNTTYTQFILSPELDLGFFGIGFAFNLEFDQDGSLRPGEWDSWQAIVSKVSYLRLGNKGEDFYLQIGSLKKATLGHGTIVDRFDNTLYMPDVRLMGVQLDIDFGAVGFETFMANLLRPDTSVAAGRLFVRPFSGLFKSLQVGATFAADFDPGAIVRSGEDKYKFEKSGTAPAIHILGADFGLPLPSLGILTWLLYADFTTILDAGQGFAAGLMGDVAFIFNWKFEFTRNSKNYISSYFDSLYLVNRATKFDDMAMNITDSYSGWLFRIWQDFSFVGKNDLTVSLQIRDSFGDEIKPMLSFDLLIDRSLLFNRVEINLNYTKNNITSFGNVFKIEGLDTFVTLSVGYMIAENVMIALVYQKTFVLENPGDPTDHTLKGQETMMVQTQFKF